MADAAVDDAHSQLLGQFMEITGVGDVAAATAVLEATNWSVEEAVNLQFATGGDLAAAGLGGGGGGGGAAGAAGGGGGGSNGGVPPLEDDDNVRAPLPVVRERLYGDGAPPGLPTGGGGRAARYGAPPPDRGPTHIDVFRDFNPSSSGAAAAAGAAGGTGAARLSDMFKLPPGLLFQGNWEAAKAHAAKEGRWLLLNVQSPDEFATHRLNRDTWGQELVQDMLRGTFVFWQVYNTSEQGATLIGQYHLQGLPAVLIIDPITGACLWERTGFIAPDALLEEMVPFMDAGPNDAGASALAQRFHQQAAKRRNKASGTGGGSSGGGGGGAAGAAMTEDEQLALALAMSVEQQQGGAPPSGGAAAAAAGGGGDNDDDDDMDEEAIWREVERRQREEAAAAAAARASGGSAAPAAAAAKTPASAAPAPAAPAAAAVDVGALQAAAAARLPPEPAEGADGACRVAFRLPDGSRLQRRFAGTDAVSALADFVVSGSADAAALHAAGGFQLAEARPGGAVLADASATVAAAGVANAMLVLRPL